MRSKGTRNARFQERRAELLARLKVRLSQRDGMRPTLRELAAAAGCSVSTLVHYFGRRDDVVMAVFRQAGERAEEMQLAAIRTPDPTLEDSVREAALNSWRALTRHGVAGTLAMGLVEGIRNEKLGPSFIENMFEPFIIALAGRLEVHVARGQMRAVDTRMAALSLTSPLFLAALHQRELGGSVLYPLDGDAYVEHVVEAFVRAYRAD